MGRHGTLARRAHPQLVTVRLPHDPRAVPTARRWLRDDLRYAKVPASLLDDVEIVLAELIANAVQHARPVAGDVVLAGWWVHRRELHVAVTDGGAVPQGVEELTIAERAAIGEGGRGLQLVDAVARAWGVLDEGGGMRTVWAALPLPAVAGLPTG
jgi:anti-sigma regulatory factor (Ser/Thr protein kinase)